jgi:hypothetical protein
MDGSAAGEVEGSVDMAALGSWLLALTDGLAEGEDEQPARMATTAVAPKPAPRTLIPVLQRRRPGGSDAGAD